VHRSGHYCQVRSTHITASSMRACAMFDDRHGDHRQQLMRRASPSCFGVQRGGFTNVGGGWRLRGGSRKRKRARAGSWRQRESKRHGNADRFSASSSDTRWRNLRTSSSSENAPPTLLAPCSVALFMEPLSDRAPPPSPPRLDHRRLSVP